MAAKTEPKVYEHEDGCVIFNHALGLVYAQAIDAYGFQREFSIRIDLGSPSLFPYEMVVYQHPGRRETILASEKDVENFVERLEEMMQESPDGWFNKQTEHRPKHHGFVTFLERQCCHHGLRDEPR